MSVTLKIACGNELRRLTVSLTDSPTLAQVTSQIRKLFPFLAENLPVPLKYSDDEGDMVTLASDADWQEAVKFAREGGKNLIRMTLGVQPSVPLPGPVEHAEPKETPAPAPSKPETMDLGDEPQPPAPFSLENLFPFFRLPQPTPTPSEPSPSIPAAKPHHAGITCDGCSVPIYGIRYKCAECYDFDLCEECEAKGEHPAHHVTMKVRIPTRVEIWHPYAFRRGPPPMSGQEYPRQEYRQDFHQRKGRCGRWGAEQQQQQQQQHQPSSETESQPAQSQAHPHYAYSHLAHPQCTRNMYHLNPNCQQQQQQQQHQYDQPPQEQYDQPPQEQHPQEQQKEFEDELRLLEDMGFIDRETNLLFLKERKGNIEEVVSKLTQLSFD